MNVTLRQLRAFLAVARTGSFTLAAESLYISQSALSGLVKELEQSMGVRLIDRSTRRVHLTEAGERLSPMLETVLHDLDEVLHRYRRVIVPEMNTGQLAMLLRAKFLVDVQSVSRVRGLPISSVDLCDELVATCGQVTANSKEA